MLLSESSGRGKQGGLKCNLTELYRGSVSFAKGDEGFAMMEFAHDQRIIDQLSFHLRGNMMLFCISYTLFRKSVSL